MALASIGVCGQAIAQETASQGEDAGSYALPDPLPACFGPVSEDEHLADCERIILDETAKEGLRKLARLERASRIYREDSASLKTAIEQIDLSDAPTIYQGYRALLLASACYNLEDYACSANQYDLAMYYGRLPYASYDAFVRSIEQADYVSTALDLLGKRLEEERKGNGYRNNYGHGILILKARLLESSDRMDERKAVLKELAGLELDIPQMANEACWDLVVDYGEPSSAQSACNTAVRLDPKSASYLDSRGAMQLAFGDHYSAVSDYERALALEPESQLGAHVRYGLALALDGRGGDGDAARAKALREQALADWPEIADEYKAYKIHGKAAE